METRFARAEMTGSALPDVSTDFTSSRCEGTIVSATLPAMIDASIAPMCRNAARPFSSMSANTAAMNPSASSASAIRGAFGAMSRCTNS